MAVRGGSVRSCGFALATSLGGRAVADGAVLEAWPEAGQVEGPIAALAIDQGSTLVVRRCELRTPASTAAPPHSPERGAEPSRSLHIQGGARATAADCTCSAPACVTGEGSTLLRGSTLLPV